MGTYKGIQGYSVQKLASDPTVTDTIGQLFYNSGDNEFKFSQQGTGSYSAGGLLNSSPTGENTAGATHAGTQTAMLAMGGQVPPNAPKKTVESYDGTSWTAANDMIIERRSATSAGTTAAAWIAGGVNTPGHGIASTENFDGTSWATGNALNTYRQSAGGFGNGSTTGIVTGPAVESFNGSTWTTENSMNTPRGQSGAGGPVTAGINAGGSPYKNEVETFDGTNWTVKNALITGRQGPGCMGGATDLVVAGGSNGGSTYYDQTESFDGTCFSEGSNMTLARNVIQGSGGPSTAGLVFGGKYQPTGSAEFTNQTEEFNSPSYVTKTITSS